MNKNKLQLGLLDNAFEINDDMNFTELTGKQKDLQKLKLDFSVTPKLPDNCDTPKVLFDNLDDFDFSDEIKIKILGIGGAGNNMINHIANTTSIDKSLLFAINTDYQVLKKMSKEINLVLIGRKITKGLGSGSDPLVGAAAAIEDIDYIKRILEDTNLLFIVSGMGKGTGTGASPAIAEIAREMNIMTISLVNLPSISNEGKVIFDKGNTGLQNLKKHTDGILTISNEKLFNETNGSITLCDSFTYANEVISNVIQQMINLVTIPSEINVDFNDIKTFFNQPTEFQVNTFDFTDDENIKQVIMDKLDNEIYQDNIKGAKKVIISYHLNPCVTNQFMNKVRVALETMTGNKDLEITFAIDYDSNVKYANLSMVIATTSDNNILANHKSIELEILNTDPENELSSNKTKKPTTIELLVNENLDHFQIENPFKDNIKEFEPADIEVTVTHTKEFSETEMTPTKLNRIVTKTLNVSNFSKRLK